MANTSLPWNGYQPPEAAATTATAPGTDDPNAVPSDPELPKTPEHLGFD